MRLGGQHEQKRWLRRRQSPRVLGQLAERAGLTCIGDERKIHDVPSRTGKIHGDHLERLCPKAESFRLPRVSYPNAYPGAEAGFAPYTNFDSSGAITGGFGFESVITDTAHSSYNALQTSLAGQVGHGGPGLQAGYTWGKSLDDVSGILGSTARPATSSSSSAKSIQHARGERSVELRRDPRLHRERSPESASRKFAISPFERPCADKRLGVSEHLDHHQRIALHGVFRDPANRLRNRRRRPPGSNRQAKSFYSSQLHAPPRRLLWPRHQQRQLLLHPHRNPRRYRT